MGNQSNDTNELTKQEETHSLRERTFGYWGKDEGKGQYGMDMYTLLYLNTAMEK